MWRAGEKAKDVCLVVAVQVDDEIELRFTDTRNELHNPSDRDQCWTIPQSDTIDFEDLVRIAGEIDDLFTRLPYGHRNLRIRETRTYRPQRGQTHHDVSELTKVYDEYVARIEFHLKHYAGSEFKL